MHIPHELVEIILQHTNVDVQHELSELGEYMLDPCSMIVMSCGIDAGDDLGSDSDEDDNDSLDEFLADEDHDFDVDEDSDNDDGEEYLDQQWRGA